MPSTKRSLIQPVLLVILDGFGVSPKRQHNAVAAAHPAYWNQLLATCPNTTIEPGGRAVGLPEGQFGNSEVGHLNLGAGRVVYQDITRIDQDIETGSLKHLKPLVDAIAQTPKNRSIHLMGLVSDGGVHSSDRHYLALLEVLAACGVDGGRVIFHAITDGRDTSPNGGRDFIEALEKRMAELGVGRIATVSGRYWAMDRDTNWDRIAKYWRCITTGDGAVAGSAFEAIQKAYDRSIGDEFLEPTLIADARRPMGLLQSDDLVIFFNFRADRARQICRALTEGPDFDKTCFERGFKPAVKLVTMTSYLKDLNATVLYPKEALTQTLGEVLAGQGLGQFRCAETEKYAHVTYFFNGGAESPFDGEVRKLIPSPKVATYDLQPQMSLPQVADALVEAITSKQYPFVLTNFANGDMVGHTGIFEAAVKAVQAIDENLQRVVEAARANGYEVLITADHGNCEEMQGDGGEVLTNHSHNPVPLVWVPRASAPHAPLRSGGCLADVAPTVLKLMGVAQPEAMTGTSLIA